MVETSTLTREQVHSLGDQIAQLSLRIDLAKHAFLTALRQFAAHEGWGDSGFPSLAAWLSWRTGVSTTTAREYVRVAKALGEFSHIDAAFARGDLSYAKVRALTRAASPATEEGLVDIAMHATAAQIETTCAAYRRPRIRPNASEDMPADLRRFMHRTTTASGMVRIEMQLSPEQAEVVWSAMNVALDAGRDARHTVEASASGEAPDGVNHAHHEVETRASAEAPAPASPHHIHQHPIDPSERLDALVSVAQAFLEQRNRPHGTGFELVMMSSPDQLESGPDGVGGFLRDGTPVPQHVARMLACDCARVDVESDASGQLLDVGRSRRTIPSAVMRALWIRDGGCRVPGCARKHHLHAHHIEHWAEGGETKVSNLALLCPGHHALVHEGQLSVSIVEGKIECRNRHGLEIKSAPGHALDELSAARRWVDEHEGSLDAELLRTLERGPRWDGSRLDLRAALDWMFGAEQRSVGAAVH